MAGRTMTAGSIFYDLTEEQPPVEGADEANDVPMVEEPPLNEPPSIRLEYVRTTSNFGPLAYMQAGAARKPKSFPAKVTIPSCIQFVAPNSAAITTHVTRRRGSTITSITDFQDHALEVEVSANEELDIYLSRVFGVGREKVSIAAATGNSGSVYMHVVTVEGLLLQSAFEILSDRDNWH